jgi:hypothetical protein
VDEASLPVAASGTIGVLSLAADGVLDAVLSFAGGAITGVEDAADTGVEVIAVDVVVVPLSASGVPAGAGKAAGAPSQLPITGAPAAFSF